MSSSSIEEEGKSDMKNMMNLGVRRRRSAPRCRPCALFRPNEELELESRRGDGDNCDAREVNRGGESVV